MKKYVRLKCTACMRNVDQLVDVTHYRTDKCTITQGCEGRLQILEYKSSAGIATIPETGVKDWQPRGTKVIVGHPIVSDEELVSLETGSLKQLVLASKEDKESISLTFFGKIDTPKDFRSYVFRKDGIFDTLSGVESGLDKKVLRFSAIGDNQDMVEVYVNGIQRNRGDGADEFKLYDNINSSIPPNTIKFNTPINEPGITQVDIIVSKQQQANQYNLTFVRNKLDESKINKGAFENIDYVEGMLNLDTWEKFYTYTLNLDSISSAIPKNTILLPKNSESIFLLARKPYTYLDRYSTVVLKIAGDDEETNYIKYYVDNNETKASATISSLHKIFPPLRFVKFKTEKTIKVSTPGVEEQIVIDGKVITGPDS